MQSLACFCYLGSILFFFFGGGGPLQNHTPNFSRSKDYVQYCVNKKHSDFELLQAEMKLERMLGPVNCIFCCASFSSNPAEVLFDFPQQETKGGRDVQVFFCLVCLHFPSKPRRMSKCFSFAWQWLSMFLKGGQTGMGTVEICQKV